ncbi:SpoIIE family protein phosphatase [Streptacidiphilus sp. ASG 303]|uniref:SpoIIE family protein phosphatase n=1 Tax=Streptacidiphilus sp. ASG 303 TaxID=2896847 RepID=UPI001E496364|nr:SpoIIE family protein phosphatase [Streptacidiphilus sp. ASG 303]MCD0485196.1 SpoIIE family protein phosphatase [Streptacidiphilus sp. ASG 303]
MDLLARTVDRLRAESGAAALVELAKGVLVERLRCSPAEAARHLRRLAADARLPLPELAADVVGRAAGDAVARASAQDRAAARAADPAADGAAGTTPVPGPADSPAVRLRAAECAALAAGDAGAAARALLEQVAAPLGATAVAVWAASPDGTLALAGQAGFGAAEAARWRHVPPGVGTLAQRALAERRTLWVPELRVRAADPGAATVGRTAAATSGARAVLPAGPGGGPLGVLEVAWPDARPPLHPGLQRQLEALADICGHTLDAVGDQDGPAAGPDRRQDLLDGLLDPAVLLRPVRRADGRVADFRIEALNEHYRDPAGRPPGSLVGRGLLEAYPLAAAEGGIFHRAVRTLATGEPHRVDGVRFRVRTPDGSDTVESAIGMSRLDDAVLLTWRTPTEEARLAHLLQHAQRLGRIGGFEEDLTAGTVTWNSQLRSLYGLAPDDPPVPLARLAAHAHPDDALAVGRFLRTVLHRGAEGSATFRLVRADGPVRHVRVVAEPVRGDDGRPTAVRGAYQDVSTQHWTEVALAATRDRLADSEQRSADRHRLALDLQQAIMPPTAPPVDAARLLAAARYRPAEKGHRVGGDWYDAAVLPDGRVMLAVGDVAGHGIAAATGMVVLRNALRGLAATGAGPGRLLGWLNTVAHHLTEHVTATAVCGLYDPATRTLRWARAGHLPPVLVRGGTAEALPLPGGVLLGGLSDASYEESSLVLERGDTLLIYTDGLIERRDCSVQESIARLLRTAGDADDDLERYLDRLLTHSNADTDDDTCLIGVRPH